MTKEKLEQLKEILAIVRKLITMDIYYAVFDKDCVVQYIYPEDGHQDGIYVGCVFPDPTGKLGEVIKTGKCIHNYLPMEKLGFTMEGNLIPVYEDGEICGAVSSAYLPVNRQQMTARELAIQSVYYLIMSVDVKSGHCSPVYFNDGGRQFPSNIQRFDAFCGKMLKEVHPDDQKEFGQFVQFEQIQKQLNRKKSIMAECRVKEAGGSYRWMELVLRQIEELEEERISDKILFMVRDIHERKLKEELVLEENRKLIEQLQNNNDNLFRQSMTDELTKLYNRKGLAYLGMRLLEKAKEKGRYVYTFVADLNGLKHINDTCGHKEGDEAIKVIADQLKAAVPEFAIVARTGGDEFTVLAELGEESSVPEEIEQRFVDSMSEFNRTSSLPYRIAASFGWECRQAAQMEDLDDCVSNADRKMYEMKSRREILGNYSPMVRSEISRRIGSAKHTVIIWSKDPGVRQEIFAMFDDSYRTVFADTRKEAETYIKEGKELSLLFLDYDGTKDTGMRLIREYARRQKKKALLILLLKEGQSHLVGEAFEAGADDVLIGTYDTELNRYHMNKLFRIHVENQNLSELLEENL